MSRYLTDSVPVRRAQEHEYEGLLEWLNHIFRPDQPEFFQRHYSHLFRGRKSIAETSFVMEREGRYIGHLGLYPLELRTSIGDLRVAGIGQVAVDPAARGRGEMARLLEYAHVKAREAGCVLCLLGGSRALYARHGYEICGHFYEWIWDDRDGVKPCEIRGPGKEIGEVYDLWKTRGAGIIWDRGSFAGLLQRCGWDHWITGVPARVHVSVSTEDNRILVDAYAGDQKLFPAVMKALRLHYQQRIYIRHARGQVWLHSLMESSGMDITRKIQGMVKILDAGVLIESFRCQGRNMGEIRGLFEIQGNELSRDPCLIDKQKMVVRQMFGDPFDRFKNPLAIDWDCERVSCV